MKKKSGKSWAWIAFILGIISLVFCWVPVFGLILSIVAIVISGIALKKTEANKGLIVAALVMSIIALLVALGITLVSLAIVGILNESAKESAKKVNYSCPDLLNMKLQEYNPLFQSWTAQVFPYKSKNVEIVYSYASIIEGKDVIYCEVGSEKGQNANWVYCGDFLRPIKAHYTDDKGTILKTRSIQIIFDKNTKEYIKTECDAYKVI